MTRLPWAALLLLSALALLVAVAAEGTKAPAPPPPPQGPAPHVKSLNGAIGAFRSDLESLRVVDGCKLLLQPSDAPATFLNLLSILVRRDSDPESGELELYLAPEGGRREWLLLATDSWPVWAAAYSDMSQLRARCASGDRRNEH